jgi:hypothetical protein
MDPMQQHEMDGGSSVDLSSMPQVGNNGQKRAQSVFVSNSLKSYRPFFFAPEESCSSRYLFILIQIRADDERKARSWTQRLMADIRHVFRRVILCQKPQDPTERRHHQGKKDDDDSDTPAPQYRLEATNKGQRKGMMGRFVSALCGVPIMKGNVGVSVNPNQRLAIYLHWMFRVNFLFLFAVMCAIFFIWVMLFAGFIVGAGKINSDCVRVGDGSLANATSQFADAFSLSWTTFSTVGYGSTYPALGHENSDRTNCFFITFICSLESFLGVLYSGFCGAILFGKVLRIQSHAQVTFSEPIVIRYGSGLVEPGDVGDDDDNDDDSNPTMKNIPCPILEFRVVNRLFHEAGGEIMDATLNVVANVDANDADDSLRDASDSSRSATRSDKTSDTHSDTGSGGKDAGQSSIINKFFLESILNQHEHHAVDEDPSARLVNKRIFSKMNIEAGEHPFFKRVWLARHVLDESSPILKPRVRRQIRRNNGHWPEKLNNYAAIRDSLQFNQILVSLNGVSNVSASDVYAQKIYDFVDINVGYQFVNILYRDHQDGSLKVDTDLINDVREQAGGGGEPLIIE